MKEIPPDPQMSILLGWCLILLLALPFGGFAAWHVAGKTAALSWPKAGAEILGSELYRTTKPPLWCVKLALRYQVGERVYASRRSSSSWVAGAGCDRDRRVMQARIERMAPGARIAVRYDPRDPAGAVVYLAPAVEFIDVFFGIVGVIWLACGIHAIRIGKRQRREQESARVGCAKPALR